MSEDGGLEELDEFFFSRASSSGLENNSSKFPADVARERAITSLRTKTIVVGSSGASPGDESGDQATDGTSSSGESQDQCCNRTSLS